MACFVVFQEGGAAWDPARPLEEQTGWREHAGFMNQLEADGFVLIGGPLKGGAHRALLVVDAESQEAVRARLATDPWIITRVLRTADVVPWEIRLGRLPAA